MKNYFTSHCPVMTETTLSPAAAAKFAGVSRSAIMRAINSKQLNAYRDNRNRWQIERDALDKWSATRPEQDRSVSTSDPITDRPVTETDQATITELATAKATIKGLEARLADTQAERDRLAVLLEKAIEPKPGLIERLASSFRSR